MAQAKAASEARNAAKAAKKAVSESVTHTVLTAEPSKTVTSSVVFAPIPDAVNEPAGAIRFGVDIAQPQIAQGDASGILASMKKAQEAPVPPPVIDPLGFFNGLHLNPDEEELLRQDVLWYAKQEADSDKFANAPFVDQSKVDVKLTEHAWGVFRLFANDYAYHTEVDRAYEISTGIMYNREGLRRLGDRLQEINGKFDGYGPLCGHNPDGLPVRVHVADMWWRNANSKDLRNIKKVEMVPTCAPDDHRSTTLNRFHTLRRGAVRPDPTATRDDIKIFDDHLLMSAGGCEVTREYVLDWWAFLYQNPGRKPSTALAFCSPLQGTGKSWFQYPLKWVFGPDLVGITGGDALYENFDDPLIGKWVGYIDELPDPRKKRTGTDANAKIKRFVTADETTMRPLGAKAVTMRTPSFVISCDSVVNLVAVIDGRRLCIIYNPDAIRDEAYYNTLFAWAGEYEPGPGMAKLAGYLAKRDVSKFNPKAHAPITAGKVVAKAASLSEEAKYLGLLFEEGHPLFDKDFGRVLDFANRLETLCPIGTRRKLDLGVNNLPNVFRELGWKKIGVDGTYQTSCKADQAWCWRDWDKWGAKGTSRKERIDHMTGGVPLTMHNGGLSQ
ncbi:primase-helicase family protein [Pseudomonas plecoglossicida]|uniref:primase-helicase family protein n=1 Tax=Pseudomonas plecoglossicida TaxID=70775 RepID=UPI00051D2319|nr:primase-helicase family protein [Pseudomonas plecoglossicida]KGK24270.1 hypothetical protein GT93_05180 [Pseudomonas plecoglossicida]